jgi:DNA helicase-2/ATP-dependent DNA helicase PcrA
MSTKIQSHAQYILIRELVGDVRDGFPVAELCVVGDADQSDLRLSRR